MYSTVYSYISCFVFFLIRFSRILPRFVINLCYVLFLWFWNDLKVSFCRLLLSRGFVVTQHPDGRPSQRLAEAGTCPVGFCIWAGVPSELSSAGILILTLGSRHTGHLWETLLAALHLLCERRWDRWLIFTWAMKKLAHCCSRGLFKMLRLCTKQLHNVDFYGDRCWNRPCWTKDEQNKRWILEMILTLRAPESTSLLKR